MFDELRPHLIELRKRLAISLGSLITMFFVMFFFHEPILTWMVEPLNIALLEVGKKSVHAADGMITTSQVGGAFFVALKVSFFAAIVGSLPIILSQIWAFIAPGLYSSEKKMVIPFVIGGTTMFITGVLFAYYVVTPFGFDFLITFGSFKFTPLINIEDYVGFFTKIMFGFGLAFQLPVFAYFLALLGLVNDKQMIAFFKYAIVIIFIVAALLTPPDILTQLLMAGPLIILYGLSIIIVKMVNPAEDEDDEEMNAEDKNEDGQIQTQDRLEESK
jgi:sec-independent protein translocase protein TatC